MIDILEVYKNKVNKAVEKFGTFVRGPVGKITDRQVRTTLTMMEYSKMEEALEMAFNEANIEWRMGEPM